MLSDVILPRVLELLNHWCLVSSALLQIDWRPRSGVPNMSLHNGQPYFKVLHFSVSDKKAYMQMQIVEFQTAQVQLDHLKFFLVNCIQELVRGQDPNCHTDHLASCRRCKLPLNNSQVMSFLMGNKKPGLQDTARTQHDESGQNDHKKLPGRQPN